MKTVIVTVGLALGAVSPASAELIAEYAFDNPAGTLASTGTASGATATDIAAGPGLSDGPSNQSFNNSSFSYHTSARSRFTNIANTADSEAGSLAGNDYAEFTITADPGVTLDLESFSFAHARGGSGATQTSWNGVRSSLDGYASTLGNFSTETDAVSASAPGFQAGAGWTYNTIALGSAFDAVTSVTFRIYYWETGLQPDVNGFFTRLDTVRVEGSVVPEPASLALMGLGVVAALGRRHRA